MTLIFRDARLGLPLDVRSIGDKNAGGRFWGEGGTDGNEWVNGMEEGGADGCDCDDVRCREGSGGGSSMRE